MEEMVMRTQPKDAGKSRKSKLSLARLGKRDDLRAFAKIYNNDKLFPANYDLERVFEKPIDAIQRKAGRYRTFQTCIGMESAVPRRARNGPRRTFWRFRNP